MTLLTKGKDLMDERLVWRFVHVPSSGYRVLIEPEVRNIKTWAIERLSAGEVRTQFNLEGPESDEVKALLSAQQRGNLPVFVIWPQDVIGVEMQYADFVQYYDDLWHPSSDDVWVTTNDFMWLLELDHEGVARTITAKD